MTFVGPQPTIEERAAVEAALEAANEEYSPWRRAMLESIAVDEEWRSENF